uniref:threonine/serine ThrE exporter family protein n=1 Tax=Prevotella sp. TaxID=59823 RepID=UPI00402514D8
MSNDFFSFHNKPKDNEGENLIGLEEEESINDETRNDEHANSVQLLRRKLDLLVRTGALLMASNADCARIMRNMKRCEAYLGLPEEYIHISLNFNIIMVNLSDETHSFSKYQRVDSHCVEFTVISKISKMLWTAIREDWSLDRYEAELEALNHVHKQYSPWMIAICAGFACGGFCVQFGCDWPAFFYASIPAILGFRLKMYLAKLHWNTYVGIAISAFVATLICWLTTFISLDQTLVSALPSFLHSDTPYHPLMACTLFIVPGVPLINFVTDMVSNYVQVGLTRAMITLMMIIAMSFGIVFAIQICGIDNFVKDLSMTPHNNFINYAIAAAVSAMGFATIYNTPKRIMPVLAITGIIAVCTRNFVNLGPSNGNIGLDQGIIIGSFVGSAVASIIATRSQHIHHIPHQIIAIPSVIPMIPGVMMYRSLFGFIQMDGVIGELTFAFNWAIKASLVILFIALGVAIPNIFIRRLIMPKRKEKLLYLVKERHEKHHDMVDLKEI